jgi:hypothetical protein
MIVSELLYPEWQKPYQEALLETDQRRLREKPFLAEAKICERLQALSVLQNHHEERLALDDAVNGLRVLEIERQ